MIRSILTAAVLIPVLFAGQSAQAETVRYGARETDTVVVSVRGADLNDQAQAQTVYNKLTAAAKRVCDSDVSDPMTAAADRACERQAVSDAMSQLRQPALSLLDGQKASKDKSATVARND